MIQTLIDINDSQLQLGVLATFAVAVALVIIGKLLRTKFAFLRKFCIPAAVVGGLLFMMLGLIIWIAAPSSLSDDTSWAPVSLNTSIQTPLMIIFFTSVGLGVSREIIRRGGKLLVLVLIAAGLVTIVQTLLGALIGEMTMGNPLLGIIAGPATMVGGHGTASAWAPSIWPEDANLATLIGNASATLGLIAGGLVGGPTIAYIIKKNNLKPENKISKEKAKKEMKKAMSQGEVKGIDKKDSFERLLHSIAVLVLCATIGLLVVRAISELQVALGVYKLTGTDATGANTFDTTKPFLPIPTYVGGLITALIFRQLNDSYKFIQLDFQMIDKVSNFALTFFLTYALMSLKPWQLTQADGTVSLILVSIVVHTAVIVLLTIFLLRFIVGRTSYDGAVSLGCVIGAGLGATNVGIANMESVSDEYGYSKNSFIAAPIVCAFLVDLFLWPSMLIAIAIL